MASHTQNVHDVVKIVHFRFLLNQRFDILDRALDGSGQLIDVLGFDNGLEVILEDLCKVICARSDDSEPTSVDEGHTLQFRATKVSQNLLPIWRIVISTQVGLQFSTQDLQSRALADTVCAYKTENLTWPGHGKSVQLEAVCRIPMGDLGLEVCGKVDDVNRTEWTFFRTDTTANAQTLGNVGNLGFGSDFDAEFAGSNDGARLFTFLTTFLGIVSR